MKLSAHNIKGKNLKTQRIVYVPNDLDSVLDFANSTLTLFTYLLLSSDKNCSSRWKSLNFTLSQTCFWPLLFICFGKWSEKPTNKKKRCFLFCIWSMLNVAMFGAQSNRIDKIDEILKVNFETEICAHQIVVFYIPRVCAGMCKMRRCHIWRYITSNHWVMAVTIEFVT